MENSLKKIVGLVFLIFFLNLGFILFAREVYLTISTFMVIILFNLFLFLDISIRPISSQKDHFKYPWLSMILFFLLPFILIIPYFENLLLIQSYLPIWNNISVYFIGFTLLIIGGLILILSRIMIGRFGSSKLTIENEHVLINSGLYKYIRHPIYLGMLLIFFGFGLSFRAIINPVIYFTSLFIIFKNRMDTEEKILIDQFGDQYESYIKSTYRLIPFIY